MHACRRSTIDSVNFRYREAKSWRVLALALGYSKFFATTLIKIAEGREGCISRAGENKLRLRLGLHNETLLINVPTELLAKLIIHREEFALPIGSEDKE